MKTRAVLYDEASGALGSIQAQTVHKNIVLQKKTRAKYTLSPKQLFRRSVFANSLTLWNNANANARRKWNEFAPSIKVFDKLGQRVTLSGLQAWIAFRMQLVQVPNYDTHLPGRVQVLDGYPVIPLSEFSYDPVAKLFSLLVKPKSYFILFVEISEPIKKTVRHYKGGFSYIHRNIFDKDFIYSFRLDVPPGQDVILKFFGVIGQANLTTTVEYRITNA